MPRLLGFATAQHQPTVRINNDHFVQYHMSKPNRNGTGKVSGISNLTPLIRPRLCGGKLCQAPSPAKENEYEFKQVFPRYPSNQPHDEMQLPDYYLLYLHSNIPIVQIETPH